MSIECKQANTIPECRCSDSRTRTAAFLLVLANCAYLTGSKEWPDPFPAFFFFVRFSRLDRWKFVWLSSSFFFMIRRHLVFNNLQDPLPPLSMRRFGYTQLTAFIIYPNFEMSLASNLRFRCLWWHRLPNRSNRKCRSSDWLIDKRLIHILSPILSIRTQAISFIDQQPKQRNPKRPWQRTSQPDSFCYLWLKMMDPFVFANGPASFVFLLPTGRHTWARLILGDHL